MKKPERIEPGQPWRFRGCDPCVVASAGDSGHRGYFDTVTFTDDSTPCFAGDMLAWETWEYLGSGEHPDIGGSEVAVEGGTMKRLTLVVSEDSAALERHCASMVNSKLVIRYGDRLKCDNGEVYMETYPETALHPTRHMRRMLDILGAERERFIIGTHSEAIVGGIGELIERGTFDHRTVDVHVVEPDGVRVATYQPNGYLANWTVGFFAPEST